MKGKVLGLAVAVVAVWGWPSLAAQTAASAAEVLTNQLVIDMVNAKLPRNIIIARIQGSRNAFDVSAEGLVFLRQREIPEPIMAAMLLAPTSTPSDEVLVNQAVIGLVDAKVPRSLIITKIRSTRTAFDVTTAGLVVLQQRKVPQAIIKVMLEEAATPPRAPPPAPARRPSGPPA